MASNGLVADPSKTEFIVLINKQKEHCKKIIVGKAEVPKTGRVKLLGIKMDNDQKWNSHFWGKKELIQVLNQRMFAIRRITNHIPKDKVRHVINSIWMSKLRYGLQLTHKV